MNILIASLLKRKITPDITASRPRIIFELASGLVQKGHNVSVLGTGDSVIPGAHVIPVIPKSFVDLPAFENPFYGETSYLVQLTKKIEELAPQFDIIHNHTYPEFINLFATEKIKTPMITTVHAQATEELDTVLSLFPNTTLVSISYAHQKQFKKAHISKVIYNGIDTNLYAFQEKKEDYLLWVGRVSKAKNSDGSFIDPKGVKWAIALARKTGFALKLTGNVEDQKFYDIEIKPYLNEKIQWVGPVSSEQALKKEEIVKLMQGSKAFLMTVNWEEPFGLVMAEAGSCGTPVIGFKRGSVPELIQDGQTGFVVDLQEGIEGLEKALEKIDLIQPQACRAHIVQNFSLERMIDQYEKTYTEIITSKK